MSRLVRRHHLESVCNLLLPAEPRLSVDLSGRLEVSTNLAVLVAEEDGVQDGQVGDGLLDVVGVDGAVLAEELINRLLAYGLCGRGRYLDLRNRHPCQSHRCRCTCRGCPCPW